MGDALMVFVALSVGIAGFLAFFTLRIEREIAAIDRMHAHSGKFDALLSTTNQEDA